MLPEVQEFKFHWKHLSTNANTCIQKSNLSPQTGRIETLYSIPEQGQLQKTKIHTLHNNI